MDRTIRASSSMIDKQIGKLWDLYKDKTAELHIQPQIVSVILAVPNLPGNILAMFRPDDKAITIIEDVLISNPEDMENIFLHELAHALDWYLYKASGHGQTFRECCRMLGALPEFSRSHVRLSIDKQNSRREKIKKLMALSSSPFENEAAEAIKKAQKLMIEGNIVPVEDDKRIYTSDLYEAKRLPFWTRELAWYASSSSGVYNVIIPGNESRIITVHGSIEEIEFALYIFDYVVSAADREIKAMRAKGKSISKGSFICGAVDFLSEKTKGTAEEKALMVISKGNEKLAKELIYNAVKIRKTYAHTSINTSSYNLGHDFGSRLDIKRSIRIKQIAED